MSPTVSPKLTFLIIEMKFNVQKEISLNCKTQDIWYGGSQVIMNWATLEMDIWAPTHINFSYYFLHTVGPIESCLDFKKVIINKMFITFSHLPIK